MRLGYVIIYVKDLITTVAFYEKAFGVTRRFVHESGYAEMETGATALAFASEALVTSNGVTFRLGSIDDAPAAIEIALVTNDVAAAYARAIGAGAVPYKEPMLKPWGQTVAYVRDNNGFLVELCTPIAP